MIDILEPAPGLRLIALPLPFELDHVNVGMVRLDAGYMLIDAGMGGRKSFEVLTAALDQMGIRWPEIRFVLATHIHPDHIGGVPAVLSASGAKLLMHRAEFDYLNGVLGDRTPWMDAAFLEGGVPREEWDAIRSSLKELRSLLSAIHPDRFIEDGESIPTAIGPARVVTTPGHSAGHVCLYWPGQRLLFSGDHMIETITPNIAWMPDKDMLGEYLESLEKVAALDIDLVIASHGRPFGNHREWIEATRRHHQERCEIISRQLMTAPRTAFELVPFVWNRDFSSFHLYFALFEVLAHLEYMRRQGRAGCEMSSGGSLRWLSGPEGNIVHIDNGTGFLAR